MKSYKLSPRKIINNHLVLTFFIVCIVIFYTIPVTAQSEKFTIEQVMSYRFPSGLVSAPNHTKIAWVQNEEGKRNIWVAEGPDYEGRAITNYNEDDGQEITDLQFTPDGRNIIYVYGGAPNRQGEIPNPTSSPEGANRVIMIVSVKGGEPKQIAVGSSPLIHPKEKMIVYSAKGKLWTVEYAGGGSPSVLFKARGNNNSVRWSPNGTQAAFVSNRDDHGYIGVYNLNNNTLKFLEPSVDRDSSPIWSPDGTKIAFMRSPQNSGFQPFSPRREGLPWSIMVADVSSGKAKEIWKADEGMGSLFKGITVSNSILWGAGDYLVFPWEKDGWVNMYSVPASGGKAIMITQGHSEVQFVSLTPDGKEIIFDSNSKDIDRKHLYRVSVSGGKITEVTSGKGIEWSPVMTNDNSIVYFASSGTEPAHTEILIKGSTKVYPDRNWLSSFFPKEDLVEPEQVIFSASDGKKIHGQLFMPKNIRAGDKCPALLFFHGGSRRQMLLGFHHSAYYHNAYALNQYLASKGFIVLSVNYRSGIGYGMKFREALHYGVQGASEYKDVVGAGLYLRSRDDVDPERIGLWGGSYGGYLTALGLARSSDLFAAGVDLHGVHDWNFTGTYNSDKNSELAKLAWRSSPLADVKDWKSPVLLIHADDDRNVPFVETVNLVEELRKLRVDFEQLIFPDDVHGFLLHKNWVDANKATADFFERKLKNNK